MSDATNAPEGAAAEPQGNSIDGLPQATQDYIRTLREEAKQNRLAAKEASDGLTAMRQQLDQMQAKAEAEKLKTVEDLQAAIVQQQTQLQQAQSEITAFRSSVKESNDRRITDIPERYRSMVPEYDDPVKVSQWLDANAGAFKAELPGTDAGQHGPTPPAGVKLSAEEHRAAQLLGIDPTAALKYK